MVPFSRVLMALRDVTDPRRAQGKRHPLPHLLLFTALALTSGARSYWGIITFLEERRDLLNQHFGVALKRAPAVNTLRAVLQSCTACGLWDTGLHPTQRWGRFEAACGGIGLA
jgi:DDE_Tnp_1-associated